MPLTKKDLSQIKRVMQDELGVATKDDVENAVETLATVVNKDFNKDFGTVQKQIELLDKHTELIEKEIQHINARLDTIEHDIAEMRSDIGSIKKHFVYRDEFEEVIARLSVVEKKLGIKTGK